MEGVVRTAGHSDLTLRDQEVLPGLLQSSPGFALSLFNFTKDCCLIMNDFEKIYRAALRHAQALFFCSVDAMKPVFAKSLHKHANARPRYAYHLG